MIETTGEGQAGCGPRRSSDCHGAIFLDRETTEDHSGMKSTLGNMVEYVSEEGHVQGDVHVGVFPGRAPESFGVRISAIPFSMNPVARPALPSTILSL